MDSKQDLEKQVMMAARDQGLSSILFRNAIARKLGLNITDSQCLSLLGIKGVCSPKELAHYTGLTTGSTTAMLDRLEKADFIRRKPNPNDRRGVLVEISEQWQVTAGPLVVGIQKAQFDLLARYSKAELVTIADFLIGFTKNVQEQTERIEESLS